MLLLAFDEAHVGKLHVVAALVASAARVVFLVKEMLFDAEFLTRHAEKRDAHPVSIKRYAQIVFGNQPPLFGRPDGVQHRRARNVIGIPI